MAMAQVAFARFSLSCFIFSLISIPTTSSSSSSSSTSSSSSSSSANNQFQFLDVSASLRHARQVLSPDFTRAITPPTTIHHHHQPRTLSLTLVSRSSLPSSEIGDNNNINNYTSLTVSRLARDEARVRSLLSASDSQLQSPLISGLQNQSGEYFARVGVGSRGDQFYVSPDTGSDVSWIQCQPCLNCYSQSDPIFNPLESSTYAPLTCLSRRCLALENPACLAGICLYMVLYGDLSYSSGDFATETISFGSSGSVPNVAIGCGHNNGGLFSGAAGLLGLGGGELSLPSQINAASFSYCLVNRDSNSSSTLDFNSTPPADSVTAPLLENSAGDDSTYRYVGLSGIRVGGEPVDFPSSLLEIGSDGSGGVIVDSGTTVSRLRREVYGPVRDKFRNMTANLTAVAGGFLLFDTCYDLSSLSEVRVPTVALEFSGGATLALPASNYMVAVDGDGTFCFAFAPTRGKMSIIGNVQQQGMRVTYDLANKHIYFSPNKC